MTSDFAAFLQVAHINTQTGSDNFVCQWQGCKVQGRSSCSRRWLERHVLSHGGNKPFRCIVDGCGSRFSSQVMPPRFHTEVDYKLILFCIHLATKESSKLFLPTVRTRIGEIFKEQFGRFVLTSSFPIETETCLCIRANNR